MSLDAGSVKGSFELNTDDYTNNLLEAVGITRQSSQEIADAFDKASVSADNAGKSEDALKDKSVSLADQLKTLAESAGMAVAFNKLSEMVMSSVVAFGEAEKVADRLKLALNMQGLSESYPALDAYTSKMQALTGISDEKFKQIAAEVIAQGKSIADAQNIISASAALASATGQDLYTVYQQLNGTYTGSVGRLNRMIPALGSLTTEQLKQGAAIDFINKQYGAFIGTVGETEIAMNSTKELVGDLSEVIGETMKPTVMLVTSALSGLVKVLLSVPQPLKDIFGIITTVGLAAFTALAIRTAVVTAAKWGLFGAQMAVNAATAVGNPLLWAGIAAATASVVAIGALVAKKVEEAKALKETEENQKSHTKATRDATEATKAQQKATEEYIEKLDDLSDKELETTRTTLIALAGRSTGTMRAYYEERLALVNKEIKERAVAKAEEERRQKAEAAAQAYQNEMRIVIQAIESAKSEEQKLLEQIERIKAIKTKNAEDEAKKQEALIALNEQLIEVRKREAEAAEAAAQDVEENTEKEKQTLKTAAEAQTEYWNNVKKTAQETFDFIGKASSATFEGMTNTLMSSIREFSDMTKSLQSQAYTNQKAIIENNYKEQKNALDRQLAEQLISQEEYDKALAALDEDKKQRTNELAKTQFENKKAANIAGVWMDAASSILGWWKVAPELGPIAGPIFAGAMTATTLAYAGIYSSMIASEEFVPAYEQGGTTKGGLTRINESGGEIVWLPDGTLVIPNDVSQKIAEKTTQPVVNITITGNYIKDSIDVSMIAQAVAKKLGAAYKGVF